MKIPALEVIPEMPRTIIYLLFTLIYRAKTKKYRNILERIEAFTDATNTTLQEFPKDSFAETSHTLLMFDSMSKIDDSCSHVSV
ncbi:MAG: hypothetical protein K2H21_05240 [Muribaculaceae bacterium]|nr:hypothetical protein [Muribaculaceae bacterium]